MKRDKQKIQAHRRAAGFSIVTLFLEIGSVIFEKNWNFCEIEKIVQFGKKTTKNKKTHTFHYICFFQRGPYTSQKLAATYAFNLILPK